MNKDQAISRLIDIQREAMHGCYTSSKIEWSLFDSIKRLADYALNDLGHTGLPNNEPGVDKP